MTTKIMALVDGLGNLVSFTLLPGQSHDIAGVGLLIKDREFDRLLADKEAFGANRLLKELDERGAQAVIPPRRNRKIQRTYDRHMYKWGVTWLKTFSVT